MFFFSSRVFGGVCGTFLRALLVFFLVFFRLETWTRNDSDILFPSLLWLGWLVLLGVSRRDGYFFFAKRLWDCLEIWIVWGFVSLAVFVWSFSCWFKPQYVLFQMALGLVLPTVGSQVCDQSHAHQFPNQLKTAPCG